MIIRRLTVVRIVSRCAATAVFALWAVSAAAQTVVIVTDGPLDGPARHGLATLEQALRTKGVTVVQGRDDAAPGAVVVLAGVRSATGAATAALMAAKAPLPEGAEALTIRRGGTYAGKPAVIAVGADSTGLMYALLDVADRVAWSTRAAAPFESVRDVSEAPFLKTRAMSMYVGMNRAFFQSRLYDPEYWTRYFDMLAADRFNQFVVAAGYEAGGFLSPIYPYLFDVPGFPDVKMKGMTAEQQAKNLASFKTMIRLAHERGIKFIMGGWAHIENPREGGAGAAGGRGAAAGGRGAAAGGPGGRGRGEQAAAPGAPALLPPPPGLIAPDATLRPGTRITPAPGAAPSANAGDVEIARAQAAQQLIPGFIPRVDGLTYENLTAYTKAALVELAKQLPDFDGFQLRMHGEAGLPADRMPAFWHEIYGVLKGIGKSVDLRAKGVEQSIFEDAVTQGLNPTVNTKVWMEQVGLPFFPTHINRANQFDIRQGYADLLKYPQTYKMTWQLWTGGTARLTLWGDPDYVRRIAGAFTLYNSDAFEVEDFGETKMHGEAHDATPIPILTPAYRWYDYEFERYWHYYRVWGRLTYNRSTTPDVWEREFTTRFGAQAGPHVMRALHLGSGVLPRIVAASYLYTHFPTTNGWPEMMRQGSLPVYAASEEGSDIQQFMNVYDEATSLLQGTDTAMRRPEETSAWFANTSAAILSEIAQAERAIGAHSSPEFKVAAVDMKILAALARYHSERLLGGVEYDLYKLGGDLHAFDNAIEHERRAVQAWSDVVTNAGDVYTSRQTFGIPSRAFPHHWSDELKILKSDFDALLAERKTAVARPDAKVAQLRTYDPKVKTPSAVLTRPASADPGRDLAVSAKVTAPAGVKWVRLRYRHVNQKEDYQAVEMALDPRSGQYTAAVPASFVNSKWDLMYFVEVVDKAGTGRMFPDLEVETPYVIVPVKR